MGNQMGNGVENEGQINQCLLRCALQEELIYFNERLCRCGFSKVKRFGHPEPGTHTLFTHCANKVCVPTGLLSGLLNQSFLCAEFPEGQNTSV